MIIKRIVATPFTAIGVVSLTVGMIIRFGFTKSDVIINRWREVLLEERLKIGLDK